jgi:signal transduction histidine kinase
MVRIIGMVTDVTAHKRVEKELADLGSRLIHAHEEEGARIARELHDDLGQRMALLQINVERLEQDMPKLSASARQRLENITKLTAEFSSELHNMSHRLHPSRLDTLGLVAALNGFCREFSVQHDVRVQFVHRDVALQIPKDVSVCLFRITQEALRNVVKHSGASEAQVELVHNGEQIHLCISDAGVGFNPAVTEANGLGLISMRERLRLVGGHLSIDSEVAHGTKIDVRIPLSSAAADGTSDIKTRGANA